MSTLHGDLLLGDAVATSPFSGGTPTTQEPSSASSSDDAELLPGGYYRSIKEGDPNSLIRGPGELQKLSSLPPQPPALKQGFKIRALGSCMKAIVVFLVVVPAAVLLGLALMRYLKRGDGYPPEPKGPYNVGFWSTNGSNILDEQGNKVLFSGVNWGGFDASHYAPHGLWNNSYRIYLDQMRGMGVNVIRLGFAGDMLKPFDRKPTKHAVDFTLNPDLKGKSCLEIMDRIIAACGRRGIRVILDYHRLTGGDLPEWGLWFDQRHTEDEWLARWQFLAQRYRGNPTVVGVDLFNEPHSCTGGGCTNLTGWHPAPFWGPDDATPVALNWRRAAKRAADIIQAVNPDLLICIQGVGEEGWWGGNLIAIRSFPLKLEIPNKLVYSVHEYGPYVRNQSWFDSPRYPDNLEMVWRRFWGYILDAKHAPIWVGEWGSKFEGTGDHWPQEQQWLQRFKAYILERELPWSWYMWTPNSYDSGGILGDDYRTPIKEKVDFLRDIMFQPPMLVNTTGGP